MAWLQAVPENPKGNKESRHKLLQKEDIRRELPEVVGCDDILTAFYNSGMAMSGGMGVAPLTWQEINAMNDGGCYALTAWDKRQIFAMSSGYCSMINRATKEIPAPYMRERTEDEAKALGLAQLRAMERAEAANNDIMKSKRRL